MVWESGKVSCWGDNNKGQLGDGEFGRDIYSSVPVEVSGIADALTVSAGWSIPAPFTSQARFRAGAMTPTASWATMKSLIKSRCRSKRQASQTPLM